MAEEVKKRSVTTIVVWALLIVFFLTMIISQLVIYFYQPIKTEVANYYDTTSYVMFNGVFVRNEKLVNYDISGVISYEHTDGSKIAKNSVVAKIYKNRNDLAIQQEIDRINEQIAVLRDAQSMVGIDNSQLESFSNQIYEKHTLLLSHLNDGDYSAASALKNDLLNLQCKKYIVKGTETSYSEKISELNAEISELRSKITGTPQQVSIGQTGYFVSAVDGYESLLTEETINDLTPDMINEIVRNPQKTSPGNVIGKLIDDYTWKMAAVFDTEKVSSVFESAEVGLRIGSGEQTYTAVVDTVKKYENGITVIIFSCDQFSADCVSGRTSQVKLLLDDYSGIRIPSEAIRFDAENNPGVFVKVGVELKFKKIKRIISQEDYTLVEDTSDLSGYISLYDTIVVEGTDLYDGKTVS